MGLLGAANRFMLSSAERPPLVPFVAGALDTAEGAIFGSICRVYIGLFQSQRIYKSELSDSATFFLLTGSSAQHCCSQHCIQLPS